MKKVLISVLLLGICAGFSFAQAEKQVPNLTQVINASSSRLFVYDKIIPNNFVCEDCLPMHDVFWAQYNNTDNRFEPSGPNENSIANDGQGMSLGWGRYSADNKMLKGWFLDFGNSSYPYKDRRNSFNSYKLGYYGGYFGEMFDVKGMAAVGMQRYNADITLFDGTAGSDTTNGYTAEADLEVLYKLYGTKGGGFNVKPFLGLGLDYTQIGAFNIDGGGHLDSSKLFRGRGRFGLTFDGWAAKNNGLYWFASAYGVYTLFGNQVDQKGVVTGAGTDSSRGDSSDRLGLGLSAGANYKVYKQLGLYASINNEHYGDLDNLTWSAGFNFSFPCKRKMKTNLPPVIVVLDEIQLHEDRQVLATFDTDVLFAFNKYDIKPEYDYMIKDAAQKIKNTKSFVMVEGNTDIIGTYEYNMTLSFERAKAVYNRLIALGVPKDQLAYVGFGYTRPAVKGTTKVDDAKNRRVDLVAVPRP